jgi:hypothetical protein
MDPRYARISEYHILADLVLITHVAFVAFVVLGLVLIGWGGYRGWGWVRNPWFRWSHLVSVGIVVVEAWFGVVCPLTNIEMGLRERAGDVTYSGTFVAHWLQAVLYYEAPAWVFVAGYTLFGLAVAGSWLAVRPRAFRGTARTLPSV